MGQGGVTSPPWLVWAHWLSACQAGSPGSPNQHRSHMAHDSLAALPSGLDELCCSITSMRSSGDAEAGSRRETFPGGERQRRLLQQWGLHSAKAGRVRPQEARAPKGAIVGEALVLTARELRLVLTLLLVMFMTGEAWRYVGTLAGPRLLVLIGGPILTAFVLIGVGLGRQLRPAETVRVPGAAQGEPARAVVAPRVAHRRLVARARGRVWLETLSVSIVVAALFAFLGVTTVDADLTGEWSGQASVEVLQLIKILGEELVVSAALLQVAGFLGALAALVFAIEVLVDEQSRYEVIDDLLAGYTQAVTIWAAEEADSAGSAGEPTATQSP
jgi:hypothetical protein